jgi:hypothetical protein
MGTGLKIEMSKKKYTRVGPQVKFNFFIFYLAICYINMKTGQKIKLYLRTDPGVREA